MNYQYTIEMSYFKNGLLALKNISYIYNPISETESVMMSVKELLKSQYESLKTLYDRIIVQVILNGGEIISEKKYNIEELR